MCSSKFYLILLNCLFVIFSLALISIGAIIQSSFYGSSSVLHNYVCVPASLTVSFGVILLVMSIMAIVFVYCRSITLLYIYICFLSLLLTIELSAGIASLIMKSYLVNLVSDSLRSAQRDYPYVNSTSLMWDSIQRDLKCCGVDHYEEWFSYLNESSVPDSCCVDYSYDCGSQAVLDDNIIKTSCSEALAIWIDGRQVTVSGTLVFLFLMQTLSFLLAYCHSRSLIEYEFSS